MPRASGEGPCANVATGTLAEVAALPEQVAIVALSIVGRADLEQRGRARTGGADQNVERDGVLIDPGSAAVGLDLVVHDQADLTLQIAGHLHDRGIVGADQRHTESRAGAEDGSLLRQAGGAVEVLEWLADSGCQVAALEIPLAGHRGIRKGHRDGATIGSAEQRQLGVAELAGADLDRVHVHVAALVVVAIAEEHGVGQEGAAGIVETLVGGPVILLDAIHKLGHDRWIGRLVVGRGHPMPGAGGEGAGAVVAAGTLAEIISLPEQIAVVSFGIVG